MEISAFKPIINDETEVTLPQIGAIKVTTRKLGSDFYQFDIVTSDDKVQVVEKVINDHCMLHIHEIPVIAAFSD
ncbi:hypothetical protein ACRYI5_01745 [Furfurilactobacillus sp. WILCCON 0119]|uniref:hypothetical protein n=1 Tax=Furfurilactobacillus entadae TaxID=2922307 RepID=UPI0035EB3FB6